MPDTLDENGLTTKTLSEITTEIEDYFKAAYGSDINIDPETPDGQIIANIAQMAIDLRELLTKVYSSFDPTQAQGVVLDQRVGINGKTRKAGSFTEVPVEITVSKAVVLKGLDADYASSLDIPSGTFTVKDDAGTQWVLLETATISVAGTYTLTFRAAEMGNIAVTIGTITSAVTIISGVTNIYNSAGASSQGTDEETDAVLKIRRQNGLASSSTGYLDAIEAAIADLDGVTTSICYENTSDAEDADGIPAHGIWAIVEGGTDADIGQTIYEKRPAGTPMKGDEEVAITRPNGTIFTAKFDRPSDVDLYVKFTLAYNGGGTIDTANIKTLIVTDLTWGVGAAAIGSTLTAYLIGLDAHYIVTNMLLSTDDTNWYETIDAAAKNDRFVMDTTRITIS